MAASAAAARQMVYEEERDEEVNDAFVPCGETFQPSWQPTLWCTCDRPHAHSGNRLGTPRGGHWESVVRIG